MTIHDPELAFKTAEPDGDASASAEEFNDADQTLLEQTTKDRMAAVFGDTPEPEQTTDEDTDPAQETEQPGDDFEETPAGEAAAEDAGGAVDDEIGTSTPDAPTLPDAMRRSLQANGWDDEDINRNLKAPHADGFLRMATKVHADRQAEVERYAEAGRQLRTEQTAPSSQQIAQPSSAQTGVSPLKPIDADAMKNKYGADEMIDEIVAPVNAAIEAMNQVIPQIQQGHQASQQNELDRVIVQVEGFFGDARMGPYAPLYGDPKSGVTPAQKAKRDEVLDNAYSLVIGARAATGRNLQLDEALTLAHEMVSKDYKVQAIRQEIKQATQKRQSGISLKPSRSGTPASSAGGRPVSRADLEGRTREGLAKVFG
jgi:hypothetical protein